MYAIFHNTSEPKYDYIVNRYIRNQGNERKKKVWLEMRYKILPKKPTLKNWIKFK